MNLREFFELHKCDEYEKSLLLAHLTSVRGHYLNMELLKHGELIKGKLDSENELTTLKAQLAEANEVIEFYGNRENFNVGEFSKTLYEFKEDNSGSAWVGFKARQYLSKYKKKRESMKKVVSVKYPLGHSIDFTYEKVDLFCPKCGGNNVWNEAGSGDYYAGTRYACLSCKTYSYLDSSGLDSPENDQVVHQLLNLEETKEG